MRRPDPEEPPPPDRSAGKIDGTLQVSLVKKGFWIYISPRIQCEVSSVFLSEKKALFAILSACAFLFAAVLRGQDETIYFRHFDRAEKSDRYVSSRILEKAKHLAELCLPRAAASGRSGSVLLEMDRSGGQKRLEARPGRRKNEIRIRFPGQTVFWAGDREQMCDLTAWCLLAKMGYGPDKALGIRRHWIVRGLARKLMSDETASAAGLPFVRAYPMAYALASHGIFADFDSILISPPDGTPPALRELADEYASLLLDICQRSGLLRGGLAEKILNAELDGTGDESLSFFSAAAEVSLPGKQQRALVANEDAEKNFFLTWFERYAEHVLLTFFTPVSAAQFEIVYRNTARIRSVDPDTFEVRRVSIADLPDEKNAPDAAELEETARRLSLLTAVSPSCLQAPLNEVRLALDRVRTGGMSHAGEAVEAERALIRETGRLCGIERYLKKVQEKQIGPGIRLETSLRSIRNLRLKQQPGSGIARLLDQWDEYR